MGSHASWGDSWEIIDVLRITVPTGEKFFLNPQHLAAGLCPDARRLTSLVHLYHRNERESVFSDSVGNK